MNGWAAWFAFMAYVGVGALVYEILRADRDKRGELVVPIVVVWPACVVFMGLYWVAFKKGWVK